MWRKGESVQAELRDQLWSNTVCASFSSSDSQVKSKARISGWRVDMPT